MSVSREDIYSYAEQIWSSMLGLEIHPAEEAPSPGPNGGSITACVQLAGEWQGAVTLDCSQSLARQLSAPQGRSKNQCRFTARC